MRLIDTARVARDPCDAVNMIQSVRGVHYGTCQNQKTCGDASSFALRATEDR